MKKLKLNLDEIKVESFEITSNLSKKGTVLGEATVIPSAEDYCTDVNCGGGGATLDPKNSTCNIIQCYTIPPQYTCDNTCYDTCPGKATCNYTCGLQYTCYGTCPGQATCYPTGVCNC